MKSQIKLLNNKTLHSAMLEYLLKDKDMKEVVSVMDIITTFPTQEIISQNKCQMRFLDKLLLKQYFDKKLIINLINCSMLWSPYTSDYYQVENVVSKSTVFRTYNETLNE